MDLQAYRIVDWHEQFEVADGRPANIGTNPTKLKKKKLDFVREDCRLAHAKEIDFCRIQEKGHKAGMGIGLACWGFYRKLCAIAADQDRTYRGWILDTRQRPMGMEKLEYLLDERDPLVLRWCMDILCSEGIKLVEKVDFPPELARSSVNKREQAEKSGTRRLFINETETKLNLTETEEVSDDAPIVSDSALAEAREEAIKSVCRILKVRPDNKSDITTIRDIFNQLQTAIEQKELNVRIYERVIDEASEADSHLMGKWGRFVNAMKREPFGYLPERRQVPGSKFR